MGRGAGNGIGRERHGAENVPTRSGGGDVTSGGGGDVTSGGGGDVIGGGGSDSGGGDEKKEGWLGGRSNNGLAGWTGS
jgi:hypothetical protein